MSYTVLSTALSVTFAVMPGLVFAEDQGEWTELEPVVVMGQQEVGSEKIDLGQKQLQQANSFFDTLKNEPSVDVAGGGASNAKRIYVRGVESSTLDITLDGATQGKNIFQHRGNELGINPDILKVVDVQTAPDASNAGALGGALSMTTKDAKDFVEDDKTSGGRVKAGYNSNTQSKLGALTAYSVFDEDFGVVFSASGVNSENYEDGNDQEMLGTAYDDRNYFLKFNADDMNGHDLSATFNQNSNSGEMQWGRTGSDKGLNVDPASLEEISSTTTTYGLQHRYSEGQLLNLDTNLYFTNILVDRVDAENEYENDNIGLKVQNVFYFDTSSMKSDLTIGFQIDDESSTSDQETGSTYKDENGLDVNSGYAQIDSDSKALFLQAVTSVNDFDISYGVRWDDYNLETGLGEESDSTLSPNLGVSYQINQRSNVYANYGQASRMTGTIPFTWMMHVADGYRYSSDLKAEKSARSEIGYNFTQGSLFKSKDTFMFEASIFRTEIDDVILSKSGLTNKGGKTSVAGEAGIALTDMVNSDETNISEGYELKVSYFIDDYHASIAYMDLDTNTTIESAGEPLTIRRIAGFDSKKVVLNAGMEVMEGLTLDYTVTGVAGIDNDQLKRGGYAVHDISAMYQPSQNSPWAFYAAVHNLTNKYYAPHTTLVGGDFQTSDNYRREVGRDIRLSTEYKF
ncbi:TonB-dependent receptor domain-containing protein [Marinomonas algarum]|uniref:TonB-dependent receptor n=1 Tax=Marinomonas algarum TaxID=2883105 RepID=A0A9X1IJJ6_9GAMM|nr:TonB-dependent receptor [Marinomonas algarum]MCB5160473.1 TonB-dependent receptor [Marinomonas algarum]